MSTVYTVLDSRDKNELNMNLQNAKAELQGNIDSLTSKHDEDKNELQQQINTLVSEKATKAELSAHNTSNSAHNDIRLLIQGLTDRLNTLADSDDETLDQMSEIVAYIEDNRDLIESITTSKVNVSDIINNLTTNVANKPLSASMGVELKRLIDAIPDNTETIVNEKILAHNIAGNAHEDIRSDVLDAQSDASGAQATADAAQAAAAAAQADVDDALSRLNSLEVGSGKLDREVSTTDGIVTCEDALVDSGLIETKFYGNTVQNLWVNPSGTINGVTVTANANGSITVSGTATSAAIIQTRTYILRPSAEYTVSVDKSMSTSNAFWLDFSDADGTQLQLTQVGNRGSNTEVTFTVPSGTAYVSMAVAIPTGATVSGTYRVMLNEGSTAEPWCPPGLNSVGDDGSVDIVTAGKNLLVQQETLPMALPYAMNGITFSDNGDGGIRISGTATNGAYYNFYATGNYPHLPPGTYTSSTSLTVGGIQLSVGYLDPTSSDGYRTVHNVFIEPKTFKLDSPKTMRVFIGITRGTTVDTVMYPQIELGSKFTGFESFSASTTPIDLQGHSLCSLPDGTRDELKIDSGGNVVLVKRTQMIQLDGRGNWSQQESPFLHYLVPWSAFGGSNTGLSTSGDVVIGICDKLPSGNTVPNGIYSAAANGSAAYLREPTFANDAAGVKEWMNTNKPVVIMPLLEPQIIDLGTIYLPRLPFSTSHVWINGIAATTNFFLPVNDLSVRYWLSNGELVADIYENGATDEMSDDEIIAIWDGATGDIVEATNADIEAIFYEE